MFISGLQQNFKKIKSGLRFKQFCFLLIIISTFIFNSCDLFDFSEPPHRADHIPGDDLPLVNQNLTVISSGLTNGEVILKNIENSDTLSVTGEGSFTFATQIYAGDPYNITIDQNNTYPPQVCMLSSASGTMPNETLNITLACSVNTYAISGTISGLAATTTTNLALQLNGSYDLTVTGGSSTFAFSDEVPENNVYNVTVKTQPGGPSQNCIIINGSGIVPLYNAPSDPLSGLFGDTGNVTDITINCITNSFTVGFNVTNLQGSGLQVTLESPAGTVKETKNIISSGNSVFDTLLTDLSSYKLVVNTQPTALNQTCAVNLSTGTLNGANISTSTHTLNCVTLTYGVSANVTGVGTGTVSLQLNSLTAQNFTFDEVRSLGSLSDGSFYSISMTPSGGIGCAITPSASGNISGADVVINVSCSANLRSIGGNIANYTTGGSLILQLNGGNDLPVSPGGNPTPFTFTTQLPEGSAYTVTVKNHPTSTLRLCTVSSGTGTVPTGSNVTTVAIDCTASDNPPTPTVTTSTANYFKGGTTFLTGSYTDDSQNTTTYPTYSSFYAYSYNWQTSTSGCTITNGTLQSASVNCSWSEDESARQVSVRVGFYDGRNTIVYSPYVVVKVFNPLFAFATASGIGDAMDPDTPGTIQTAITSGSTKVAVQVGTYNYTTATAITMTSGVKLYGRYATNWFSRNSKSTVNHLNSANSSIITHNYASSSGKAFNFVSNTSATLVDGMTVITPNQKTHYGFYISGGNPVLTNNYYVSNTTTGFLDTIYQYGVYCSSCYARIEKNFFDIYKGYGIVVSVGSASGFFHGYNNIIRLDKGIGLYVSNSATNYVFLMNNTIINRYATKSVDGSALYLYGSSAANEPIYVYFYNNNLYAQYGVFESNAYSNPRYVYNNNFYGPTAAPGYTAYYDYQGYCTANGDGDSNPKTCTAAEGNTASPSIAKYTFYGNFSLNSSIRYSTSAYLIGDASDPGFYIGDYYGSATSMLYGARSWSSYFTDDFTGITRTYTVPTGTVWTTGATPYLPSGASLGAFEH